MCSVSKVSIQGVGMCGANLGKITDFSAFSGIVKERISAQAGAQFGFQGREDALDIGVGRPTDGFAARGSPEILNARRK